MPDVEKSIRTIRRNTRLIPVIGVLAIVALILAWLGSFLWWLRS